MGNAKMSDLVINPDPLLDTKAAASYVGCTANHLAQLRMRRQGPAYFKHGSLVRYRRSALDDWINQNTCRTG